MKKAIFSARVRRRVLSNLGMTRSVYFHCPISAEIRTVDSQSDLRIFLIVKIIMIILMITEKETCAFELVPSSRTHCKRTAKVKSAP